MNKLKLEILPEEIYFEHLTFSDIDVIEEQLKDYEKENGAFTIEKYYMLDVAVESVPYGNGEYNIEVKINIDTYDYEVLFNLDVGEVSRKVASEYEDDIFKYLKFRFVEQLIEELKK